MNAALPSMLYHYIVIDPDGPARPPLGEMVLQMNAVDLGVFGGNSG
jgi:hypothetical protein